MAKVMEIDLGCGRRHQVYAYRYARQELSKRNGGIILADGVGLGKTYEALAATATLLSQRQHSKLRKKRQAYRVIVIVPPGLVTKWTDELLLPDRFTRYLDKWISSSTKAVVKTFKDVAILRKERDLWGKQGELRYRKVILPEGFYIVNVNLLAKGGKKITQIHKTPWDAIIVDEAHRTGRNLLGWKPNTILANPKTATFLLTATPFQLSPKELKVLLETTFGGYGNPVKWQDAKTKASDLYNGEKFYTYRRSINSFFRSGNPREAKDAMCNREEVSKLLVKRIIRNPKKESRRYFIVDGDGNRQELLENLYRLEDEKLKSILRDSMLIELDDKASDLYMRLRDQLAEACSKGPKPFVATALRQLLSTYQQFKKSKFGRLVNTPLPLNDHPKLNALEKLVGSLLTKESKGAEGSGWIGKVLIFTTYVGAEKGDEDSQKEDAYGTASQIKQILEKRLRSVFPRGTRKKQDLIRNNLVTIVEKYGKGLEQVEKKHLLNNIRWFAGSPMATTLLSQGKSLKREARKLKLLLSEIDTNDKERKGIGNNQETLRRMNERRTRIIQNILDRYSTRHLVARYDGAIKGEDRDRHLRGFNSPYAPLVLIASSVGQEGIDLQRYCRHVIHYDLEWNPAKLEQREGRVDREGRESNGPVNVYFLLCRGTYDERMMHVMVNRFRWHQVLLAHQSALKADPSCSPEVDLSARVMKRISLDLRPRRIK